MIFLQLDHMHVDYDSNNKHTPPPIPTFGWTGGLEMHLNLELQVCIFFSYLSYSTNNYCHTGSITTHLPPPSMDRNVNDERYYEDRSAVGVATQWWHKSVRWSVFFCIFE